MKQLERYAAKLWVSTVMTFNYNNRIIRHRNGGLTTVYKIGNSTVEVRTLSMMERG